jgi:hypothetical protein
VQPVAIVEREELAEDVAHGCADHVGVVDPVAVEHADRIPGKVGQAVGGW